MLNLLLRRAALFLVLVASVAVARDRQKVVVRTLLVSDHPGQSTPRVHVAGQIATVLRFEQPCDPVRTKLLGWEGRFEPVLVGGKKVVLEPLRDLDSDERFPLLVTLTDGTEIPFVLGPPSREEWGWTDQQVNVFKDPRSYDAVLSSLYDALGRKKALEEENERFRKEETSADHALAALLVSGSVKQTPFVLKQTWSFKDVDADVAIAVFSGKGKAAVVFNIKNNDPERSWMLTEARLTTESSGHPRPAAVRSARPSILPGTSGAIAVVADKSAFMDEGAMVNLALEIFRDDGYRQAMVLLDPHLIRE
jgi:uncharacterized protein (TIGR02268 family)